MSAGSVIKIPLKLIGHRGRSGRMLSMPITYQKAHQVADGQVYGDAVVTTGYTTTNVIQVDNRGYMALPLLKVNVAVFDYLTTNNIAEFIDEAHEALIKGLKSQEVEKKSAEDAKVSTPKKTAAKKKTVFKV